MNLTNKMNLPEALVKAVSIRKHNDPGRLSATTLLNGVKQIILTDRHWDDLEEDVADHVYALFGTAVHKVLEHEGADEFTEEFISYEIDGITVTGKFDNYNMKTEVLSDYKNVSVWKVRFGDYSDWKKQGLIYAWLLIKNGFNVKTCRFIAFLKDHSKREAKRNSDYPKCPAYVYEFDVTDQLLAWIEGFIEGRIAAYKSSLELPDNLIPPCSAEERWEKPTTYAVIKNGNKRAFKVLNTIEEAEKIAGDMGANYHVEIRIGESTRCSEYCSCCEFCNYYRDTVAAAEELGAPAA